MGRAWPRRAKRLCPKLPTTPGSLLSTDPELLALQLQGNWGFSSHKAAQVTGSPNPTSARVWKPQGEAGTSPRGPCGLRPEPGCLPAPPRPSAFLSRQGFCCALGPTRSPGLPQHCSPSPPEDPAPPRSRSHSSYSVLTPCGQGAGDPKGVQFYVTGLGGGWGGGRCW